MSLNSSGVQANNPTYDIRVSADGTKVALVSPASNLGESPDDNGMTDVFLRDLTTGRTLRVSQKKNGRDGDRESQSPAISADGAFVAFRTDASNLFTGDDNNANDVLVYDVARAANEVVSVASDGTLGNAGSGGPWLSRDGNLVLFSSLASNLDAGDGNNTNDVFLRDRAAGTTRRVSLATSGAEGHGDSFSPSMTDDGRLVCFSSAADDLGAGDAGGFNDVFVKDLVTGTLELISKASNGAAGHGGHSAPGWISGDGRYVAFMSEAYNLFPGDVPGTREIYVRDRQRGVTELASMTAAGGLPDRTCEAPLISGDGRFIFFTSDATNLVPGAGGHPRVYVRDRVLGVTMLAVYDKDQDLPDSGVAALSVSADGRFLGLTSDSPDLTEDDASLQQDAFLRERTLTTAASSNYGAGWPGTHGVPTLTAAAPPALGQTLSLSTSNSYGRWTVALFLVGGASADIQSGFGGHLLLLPGFAFSSALAPNGTTLAGRVPADERLSGTSQFVQVLELDPGGSDGVSFTEGLELVIGF